MSRVISFDLSESGIDRALKELEQYETDLTQKTEKLRQRVTKRLQEEIESGFRGAIVDDIITSGGARNANVTVSVSSDSSLVIASGEDAVWVEFGAGVYHNGSAGSSPHPKGSELGYTIGSFGDGNGNKNVWGYYRDGELVLTHGTPAEMPMYHAVQTVCREIDEIAREVFA